MKKLLLLVTLFISASVFAQNTDSLINLIYKEKTDTAHLRQLYVIYDLCGSMNPIDAFKVHKQLLELTKREKDRVAEAIVTSELGWLFQISGSTVQGTRLLFDAVKIAEEADNPQAIGITYQNLSGTSPNLEKFKEYNEKALHYSTLANDPLFMSIILTNLGTVYTSPMYLQMDSALSYAQKSYQLARLSNQSMALSASLLLLSRIYQNLGNNGLALEYLRVAECLPSIQTSNENMARVYNNFTIYYENLGQRDSALYYAYKNLHYAKSSYLIQMNNPVFSLKLLYTGVNTDSALKYTNLFYAIKDSLLSTEALQRMQAMTFEEDQRQEKLNAERKQNIQFTVIAIALVVFAIIFFLFSHSVIASAKVIKSLAILSLLIVFEFINLIIHPYLGDLTHHSPVMMLGFMVCLAALLIPFHHKLEHWITHKLIEKNNRIRLAAAKKTIEQLEPR